MRGLSLLGQLHNLLLEGEAGALGLVVLSADDLAVLVGSCATSSD